MGRLLLLISVVMLLVAQAPPVRVNVLNVCTPSEEEQKEIAAALARIPVKAAFSEEFEISRGRSTMPEAPVANWVRVRREFSASEFSSAQYSMSADENSIVETLVLKVRDPKEILQISIEDRVSAPATPAVVVSTNTPARRVKVERFGKASVAISRCEQADQTAYEPLFRAASKIMANYRDLLGVRRTVPADMARLGVPGKTGETSRSQAGQPPKKSQ